MAPQPTLEQVLVVLNDEQIRATYEAVAELVGIALESFPVCLGQPRPFASWIVNAATGLPAKYPPAQIHPALRRSPRILASAAELKRLMVALQVAPPAAVEPSRLDDPRLDAAQWAQYEKEFPYDPPPAPDSGPTRLSHRTPTVSGGLPSSGKRR
jgi:hypothetical protein